MDDRKHIAELSDWQLKDLGLSRILTDAESQKSFLIPWWCIHSIITPFRTEQSGLQEFLFLDFALSVGRHWSFLTAHLCETYPMTKSYFQMMARFGSWTNQRLVKACKWKQTPMRTMVLWITIVAWIPNTRPYVSRKTKTWWSALCSEISCNLLVLYYKRQSRNDAGLSWAMGLLEYVVCLDCKARITKPSHARASSSF